MFKDHLDEIAHDLWGDAWTTFHHLEYRRDEDFWLHTYMKRFHRFEYNWLTKKLEPNSFEEWDYGFQVFQGFYSWRKETVRVDLPVWGPEDFWLWVPHTEKFLYKNGSYKVPVYKEEEYTRYRITTYEVKDHQFENQGSLQSEVILTPHNGYDDVIRLEIEPESAKAELESTTLTPSSPCSTTLNAETPVAGTHGNHTIGVRACDADGRLVETRTFRLNIQVPEKPPVEKTVLRTAESDIKPPESGEVIEYRYVWGGVGGRIKDSRTGSPVANATVHAWEDGKKLGSKSSYSDGRYSFHHIMGRKDSKGNYYGVNPSYTYWVWAWKKGYRPQRRFGTWERGMEDMPVYVNVYLTQRGA